MRGQSSSDRRILLPVGQVSEPAGAQIVLDDFGDDFPVTDAELDVVESFFMSELSAILKSTSKSDSKEPQRSDNDNCQTS
ncbi:hypothetical protein ASD50_03580 [Mesorhizobium sp. Root552]|jgi:hypothetical protein|uniref:hypothetical protein n=1 Tax=Mesorhizobium sp. Root552 TaxID=1736555 RepID=UPI0006F240EE|nr:hypothetical protein [Mesorhizobium sp. Root552]KQZ26500.1 hypothetical protein ASD50_03580 [Mesorhizobium sp. Root552]